MISWIVSYTDFNRGKFRCYRVVTKNDINFNNNWIAYITRTTVLFVRRFVIQVSTEDQCVQSTRGESNRSRLQAGRDEQVARRRGLWWTLSVSEFLTLASSWVALWLTVEVVPANVGLDEANPLTAALLDWSTTGLALFVLCVLVVALGLLRVAEERVSSRRPALVLAMGTGAVAALNLVDAGWNLLLLTELGAIGIVGVPGPAVTVFGLGAVAYLGAVHWVFYRRSPTRATDPAG